MQISLMLGNLKQPFEQSLQTVQSLEIPAIHLSAHDRFDPANLTPSARRELQTQLADHNLIVSALSRWGGEVDLGEPDPANKVLDDARRTLDLAAELGNGIWQAHVGVMPYSMEGERWDRFVAQATSIASHGERVGACLAIETGPEPASVAQRLIETVNSPGLRINYDPANLILWPGLLGHHPELRAKSGETGAPYDRAAAIARYEPVEGVKRLGRHTVHVHAKDALVEDGNPREVPLGEGWVDWPRLLQLLKESGFDGYLAIERETGGDPVGDIRRAAEFLKAQLAAM